MSHSIANSFCAIPPRGVATGGGEEDEEVASHLPSVNLLLGSKFLVPQVLTNTKRNDVHLKNRHEFTLTEAVQCPIALETPDH